MRKIFKFRAIIGYNKELAEKSYDISCLIGVGALYAVIRNDDERKYRANPNF